MEKGIDRLIHSMDVKQDREDAESKANSIFKFGDDAIDQLVAMGNRVNEENMDPVKKKKLLRAIIFTLLIFIKNNETASFKKKIGLKAKNLLFSLASQGYESAKPVIYDLGFYDSDILKEQLLSLPIVEKHIHDKEISLNEAILEVNVGKTYTGFKGMKDDHYLMGFDGKHHHQVYRIEKKLFGLRSSKNLKN